MFFYLNSKNRSDETAQIKGISENHAQILIIAG
jgi:hypothetical protein